MREDLNVVELKNEGLVVFLYDEKNRELIDQANPAVLHGLGGADPNDDLKALAGQLVAYELAQDDDVRVGVGVGEPLTTKEKKGVPWLKAQTALLSLPSGKLCIESYNSLRLGGADPDETGARVEVKPGEYTLTLHRVDTEKLEEEHEGPSEVITLTPVAQLKPPARNKAYLSLGDAPRAPWVGRYQIEDGLFRGEVIHSKDGAFSINLDPAAAKKLGLERGAHLVIECGGAPVHAFFQGDMHPDNWDAIFGSQALTAARAAHPDLQRARLRPAQVQSEKNGPLPPGVFYRDYVLLGIFRVDQDAPRTPVSAPRGTPVTVRVVAPPFAPPPDRSWVGRCKLEGEIAHAEVIDARPNLIQLNVGEELQKKLKVKKAGAVELSLNGKTLIANEVGTNGGTDRTKVYFHYTGHYDVDGWFFTVVRDGLSDFGAKLGDVVTVKKIR